MEELISIGKAVIDGGSFAALVGFLVVLSVPKLKKRIFGSETDNLRLEELESFKSVMESNHLHDIEELKDDVKSLKSDMRDVRERVVRIETKLNGKLN